LAPADRCLAGVDAPIVGGALDAGAQHDHGGDNEDAEGSKGSNFSEPESI